MNENEILIVNGGEIKSLGGNRFGGWAAVFGDASRPDASAKRDYMDASTDFWVEDEEWGHVKAPVIYHHGLDPALGRVRLGQVTYEKKDAGIWAEGVLKLRADYEAKYADHLAHVVAMVEAKKLGLSTGVPGHLVERQAVGNAHYLKSWPIGRSELSLTPTPAEPRTMAYSLKSLMADESADSKAVMAEAAGYAPANNMACPRCGSKAKKVTCAGCGHALAAPATKSLGGDPDPEAGDAAAAAAPTLADRSRALVSGLGELKADLARHRENRARQGRPLSAADREVLAAVLDAAAGIPGSVDELKSLLAGVKAPDPREADRRLFDRALALRSALRGGLTGA
jgi:hypothetical protein